MRVLCAKFNCSSQNGWIVEISDMNKIGALGLCPLWVGVGLTPEILAVFLCA